MKRNNRITMIALVVAVIVVSPFAYFGIDTYLLSSSSHPIPITAVNSTEVYVWKGNYMHSLYPDVVNLTQQNLSVIINGPGLPESFLNATVEGVSALNPMGGPPPGQLQTLLYFNVSGHISSELKPRILEIRQNYSISHDLSFSSCVRPAFFHRKNTAPLSACQDPCRGVLNSSECHIFPSNITESLINQNTTNISHYYNFYLYFSVEENNCRLYQGFYDYLGFQFILQGLSKPVEISLVLEVMDNS
ncbi:MAG: hypothetical protein M1315_04765 [Candidatus Thermoplasmatota archaeon]|nr:hypothetical protein [Candidatus Thermoplasmatota archaeon]